MEAVTNIVVLLPSGYSQNIDVTPKTTVLQVLEEACQSHGYNTNDYGIKHANNVLNVDTMLCFTNLRNNAEVEMVSCSGQHRVSNVLARVSLETNGASTKEVPSDLTLMQVLKKLCPDDVYENIGVRYTHHEIYGEALEEVTLKSLGANDNLIVLKLLRRDRSALKNRSNETMIPLTSRPSEDTDSSSRRDSRENVSTSASYIDEALDIGISNVVEENVINSHEFKDARLARDNNEERNVNSCRNKSNGESTGNSSCPSLCDKNESNMDNLNSSTKSLDAGKNIKIEFLGERNALVFHQGSMKASPRDELPENFFDLTVNDAKIILRDVKRRRKELEDAPLLTAAQRRLNETTHMLEQLTKYRYTVIRIQFPDRLILQGLFKPLETVQSIKDFVKSYLNEPNRDFTIYTTPPKYVLKPSVRLIDEKLVPSAIVYYSGPSCLKPDTKEKLTDPKIAAMEAIKLRKSIARDEEYIEVEDEKNTIDNTKDTPIPGPSNAKDKTAVPKWFKNSFK